MSQIYNRGAIFEAVNGYTIGRKLVTRFWDKAVVLYCVRDLSWHDSDNRDTTLKVLGNYISIHCPFFDESFKREKLGKEKEVTLGLRVFD